MEATKIARDNLTFYCTIVSFHLYGNAFAECVCRSITMGYPLHYDIENSSYPGYIIIDATDINRNNATGGFQDAVKKGILKKVARDFPLGIIDSKPNTDFTMLYDIWKFTFKITHYEVASVHGPLIVDDPLSLPDDEKIGRFVKLTITFEE